MRFYNKTLNPNFWKDGEFDGEVRQKLLDIANDFFDSLELDINYTDIQLTGSIANYNWTKYSDLDVHILVDFSKINDDVELVKKAFDGKRFIWNLRHNIKFYGHEVELYVQDDNEPHVASGLYSLENNMWLKEPKYDPPQIDHADIRTKVRGLTEDIRELGQKIRQTQDSDELQELFDYGKRLKDKIQKMRKEGLSKEGEFSVGNLAFKILRNSDAIEKLIDLINHSYDKSFMESANNFSSFVNRRQQNPATDVDSKYTRKSLNLLPDRYRHDPTENPLVKKLKNQPSGTIVVPKPQVELIKQQFNITDLSPKKPRNLGNTGITIMWNPILGSYILKK